MRSRRSRPYGTTRVTIASGDSNCDLDCLRPTYKAMRAAGLMTPLISGEAVTVTSVRADPEDRRYRVCGVRVKSRSWDVLCDALDEP
jgi:hypothetical protein